MYFDVIDDFLPKPYLELIKEKIFDFGFPWYFKKDITYPNPNFNIEEMSHLDSFGFDHFVLDNCEIVDCEYSNLLCGFFGSLMHVTEHNTISKCRIDMTLHTTPLYKHRPHVDLFTDHIATVFYLNDSDGDTEIYAEKCYSENHYNTFDLSKLTLTHQVEPKENRLLIFDGTHLHTGHSPANTKNRAIINTDLLNFKR